MRLGLDNERLPTSFQCEGHMNELNTHQKHWKLASHDVIVSHLFKPKYFSNGDFLGTRFDHNPSFFGVAYVLHR